MQLTCFKVIVLMTLIGVLIQRRVKKFKKKTEPCEIDNLPENSLYTQDTRYENNIDECKKLVTGDGSYLIDNNNRCCMHAFFV